MATKSPSSAPRPFSPSNTGTPFANGRGAEDGDLDRKSTRLNSSHSQISYAVFCLKKKKLRHIVVFDIISQHLDPVLAFQIDVLVNAVVALVLTSGPRLVPRVPLVDMHVDVCAVAA